MRAMTGAGLMDCKQALDEAGGDFTQATELLRKKGVIKAGRRAQRIATEGLVVAERSSDGGTGALVEVNCETDFVGKSPDFVNFCQQVARAILAANPADLSALSSTVLPAGQTVQAAAEALALKIGEKISVRRFVRYSSDGGAVYHYIHGTKIGALVELAGGTPALGLDVALHIAAANPKYLDRASVPASEVEREKEIYAVQLRAQGKPENTIVNILKGKLDKFYSEVCLIEQPFVKNEDVTVGKMLEPAGARAVRFVRFELGEGFEKAEKNFAAEVAAQLK